MSGIALDPGNGGRSILPEALVAGDIILSTTTALVSDIIRAVTQGSISHATLYVGTDVTGTPAIIQAVGGGVKFTLLEDALAEDSVAVAFRHPQMTADAAALIIGFARQELGKPYDLWGAIRDALFRLLGIVVQVNLGSNDGQFYCSELVIKAFANGGLSLTLDAPQWLPQDLVVLSWLDQLEYVGHLKF